MDIIPNAPSVFISYTDKDVLIAESIAVELINLGINVWFDKWRIHGGDSILDSIDEAIQKCDTFIVLISRNAMKSPWVRKETAYAFNILLKKPQRRRIKVVPIRIDDCSIPFRFQDMHVLTYSSNPEVLLQKIVPIIDPTLQLEPNSTIQYHNREQFFNKAITILKLQPSILHTTLVGPIFLYSKAMVRAKQDADKEERPSFSNAIKEYLLTQKRITSKSIAIVIKLIPRYENILKSVGHTLDLSLEISRMKSELDQFIPDDDSSGVRVAVSREYQYAFLVTDKILIEAERYSSSEKMQRGWSSTQPLTIKNRTEMFNSAFNYIFKGNRYSKTEIVRYLDGFAAQYV